MTELHVIVTSCVASAFSMHMQNRSVTFAQVITGVFFAVTTGVNEVLPSILQLLDREEMAEDVRDEVAIDVAP